MTEKYWCVNCNSQRDLNIHGRCSCCDSEAVCLADPGKISYDVKQVEQLLGTVAVQGGK